MIYVKRSPAALPPALASKLREKHGRAAAFFRRSRKTGARRSRAQLRFEWDRSGELKELLTAMFHSKCAYCERRVEAAEGDIELFRPRQAALDLDGQQAPDHYWWLAYEWSNHLLACKTCNLNKRGRFPIQAAQRARFGARGAALDQERPLLIDPTREDPLDHLQFVRSGEVEARSLRGEVSIATLALNRPLLVRSRRDVLNQALSASAAQLSVMIAAASVHAGAVRSCLAQGAFPGIGSSKQLLDELASLPTPGRRRVRSIPGVARAKATTKTVPHERPLEPSPVQRLSIRNFRAIQTLDLKFQKGSSDRAGWKVLLGENAAGKSTVLKAIALALVGQERANQLAPEPHKLLRRWRVADARKRRGFRIESAKSASIRLETLREDVIDVRITPKRIHFRSGVLGMSGVVRGYGSLRLLSRTGGADPTQTARTDNLFDPATPLVSAREWMMARQGGEFSRVGKALKVLLGLERAGDIESADDGVWFDINNSNVELADLSDGYQSMVALAVDLMAGMPGGVHEMQYAHGIVLLDELGTHLHPRWRMQVVKRLRDTFSNLQVIASTHEPLCLLGLEEGEIAVMRRTDFGEMQVLTELPSPKGMRADQILTSPLFGLHSTIDEDIDTKFQEYYALLAAANLKPRQERRRDELAQELQKFRVLGYTRRDQLIYETIDAFLANERNARTDRKRARLLEGTKAKLNRIWRRVDASASKP